MTEAVRLLQKFMDSCLQQRSRDAMLSCVTEDICCAGIGAFASVSGRKELEHSFFSGMRQYPQPIFFSIGKTEEKELGGSILLSFSMQVQVGRSGPLSTLQGSMVACRENGALKITMLHVSEKEPPASAAGQYAQILGPLFPSYSVRTVHAVKEKGAALFSRMVPGGMMGGYVEKGFPLYFINDRLLEYLGYTYQEFIEDTKGYVINGIYPDDRIPVIRTVEQSFQHSKEYRVKYRMKKKDGSYIWVDDYGRFVTSEDGRPAIISVCIDITEIGRASCRERV